MYEKKHFSPTVHLFFLLIILMAIKVLAACVFELHYNEAYYISYAQYPAISQFDHPPIVGFIILLTTLGLTHLGEFFVRLGPLVMGTASVYLIYRITTKLKNERAGIISAYLSACNIYILVFCGLFILPDCGLLFFSLLSFNFFINYILGSPEDAKKKDIFFSFLFLGLAIYSKYSAVFLGVGILLYIIFFNRVWFKKGIMYLCTLIPLFFIGLIMYWNSQNSFTSFSFHDGRFYLFPTEFNFAFFTRQLTAQLGVTNPVNFIIVIIALIAFRKKKYMSSKNFWLVICCSAPLILTVLYIAMDSGTNAHWTGPSYACLMIVAACFLDDVLKSLKFPAIVSYFTLIILIYPIGVIQWNWYQPAILSPPSHYADELGERDWRLNLTGWTQVNKAFEKFIKANPEYKNYPLVSYNYRNTSELVYYIGLRHHLKVYTLGTLWDTHKYFWINREMGELKEGANAIYIAISSKFYEPDSNAPYIHAKFKKVKQLRQIPIYLHGQKVEYAFIYLMKDFSYTGNLKKSEFSL